MTNLNLIYLISIGSLFVADTSAQQFPLDCQYEELAYTWRLSVTITDSSPISASAGPIDTLFDNTIYANRVVAKSGEPLPGVVDGATLGADWQKFSALDASGTAVSSCTMGLMTYSLLSTMNGGALGSRITRYLMKVDPNNGNITGTVQYESLDLAGNLYNMANGTLTGILLTTPAIDITTDPYFVAYQLPNCNAFPSNFVPFTSVYYVTKPNSAGDELIVGNPGAPDPVAYLQTINTLPLPYFANEQFCGQVTLALGYTETAYLPTSAERNGNFGTFGVQLIDPMNNTPFPGNVIPQSRLGQVFAWRVPRQGGLGGNVRRSGRSY